MTDSLIEDIEAQNVVNTTSLRAYEVYSVARDGNLEEVRVVNETLTAYGPTQAAALGTFVAMMLAWWRNKTMDPGLVLFQERLPVALTENDVNQEPESKRWQCRWRGGAVNLGTKVGSISRTEILYEN